MEKVSAARPCRVKFTENHRPGTGEMKRGVSYSSAEISAAGSGRAKKKP